MEKENHFYKVNGSYAFGYLPRGIVDGIDEHLEIRLQYGNIKWGAKHIQHKHGRWLADHERSVESMLHYKLSQSGIYEASDSILDTKLNLFIQF